MGVLYYCKMLTKNEKVMNVGGILFTNLRGQRTEGISEAGDGKVCGIVVSQ